MKMRSRSDNTNLMNIYTLQSFDTPNIVNQYHTVLEKPWKYCQYNTSMEKKTHKNLTITTEP